MNLYRITAAIFLMVVVAAGCKKADEYPIVPVIGFKSLYTDRDAGGYDVKAHVVITFTDGDGDIGYYSSGNGAPYDDTTSQYYSNFHIKLFEKRNSTWIQNAVKFQGRMPYLTPEGSNKALKGEIAMELPLPLSVLNDTIRYDIFIFDRALHQSNTITTAEIIIKTH